MTNQEFIQGGETLTVIMPSYNEEALIETAVKEVREKILDQVPGSSLLVVDGGSADRTVEILERLGQDDSRIVLIHEPGCKHGPSLILGMKKAIGEYIFLIDSDMQIPLDCFAKLWDMRTNYDAIFGIRQKRQDPKQRLIISLIAKTLIKIVFGIDLIDANAPCKLFKRSIWQNMSEQIGECDLIVPSMFIAIFTKNHNYRVIEVPVAHKARSAGQNIRLDVILKNGVRVLSEFLRHKEWLTRKYEPST